MKEIISIPPSTNLIDVIASEYNFNSAIADLIDNCLDGKATKIEITYENLRGEYNLHILDNGHGMTKEHLKDAAIIGFQSVDDTRKENALGRYSTGLKAATSFLACKVKVVSKVKLKDENILIIDYEARRNFFTFATSGVPFSHSMPA